MYTQERRDDDDADGLCAQKECTNTCAMYIYALLLFLLPLVPSQCTVNILSSSGAKQDQVTSAVQS